MIKESKLEFDDKELISIAFVLLSCCKSNKLTYLLLFDFCCNLNSKLDV